MSSMPSIGNTSPAEFAFEEVGHWGSYDPIAENVPTEIGLDPNNLLPDLATQSSLNMFPEMEAEDRDDANTTTQGGGDSLDELDLMICHEDFASLVALAAKVTAAMEKLQSCELAKEYYKRNAPDKARSSLKPSEVVAVVERMKDKFSTRNFVVRRGMYPMTDAIMEDNFMILQKELELCQASLATAQHAKVASPGQTDAIAVKYSKWQTDILMNWMIEHKADPFPSLQEIHSLSEETGLSHSQVVNWTTNVRKRNRKATLSGKKPHHFVDFVFLAQDRDDKKRKSTRVKKEVKKELATSTPPPRKKEVKKELVPLTTPPRKKATRKRKKSTPSSATPKRKVKTITEPSGDQPPVFSTYGSPHSHYNHGYYLFSTPPPPSTAHPMAMHAHSSIEGGRLSHGDHSKSDWNGNLFAVSTSFDEAIEPIFNVDEIDEGPLHDFAQLWGPETFGKDLPISKAPKLNQADLQCAVHNCNDNDSSKNEPNVSDQEETAELPPATLDPPDLRQESSLDMDWDDLDDDYFNAAAGLKVSL